MADTGQRSGYTSSGSPSKPTSGPSGWTVWVLFAGVIMMLVGILHAIDGLVAIFDDDYYLVGSSGLVVSVDYTVWGWTHLLIGLIVFAAGCGAITGQIWARSVGVFLAVISAVINMVFIAAYPMWSIIIITLDVLIIYSLIVHGRELKDS